MSRRRVRWTSIAGTPARYAHELVARDGVTVLCVRLSGYAENNPNGVGRVSNGLDALGATMPAEVEVATLDVTEFCNASDDASEILTAVFAGLPCCWVTSQWDRQHEGQRWDLPASERMAPTREEALARVVGWRRAGGFTIVSGAGRREARWTERGLVVRDVHAAVRDCEDLWHRNVLVERVLAGARPTRVRWPHPDRTGVPHEAERRRARLVYEGERVIEADLSPWQTGRPLAPDWPASIADLTDLATLVLRGTDAREPDILRVIAGLPALTELAVAAEALSPAARERLALERPTLSLRA